MTLHFRDIQDWTPASISIVDKPYHPLAVFEVYENDDEFIKKYINPQEDNGVENMVNNNQTPAPAGDNITVSGGFFESLLDKLVAKSEPVQDSTTKEILEELKVIKENQVKTDERIAKLENPQEPTEPPAEPPVEPTEPTEPAEPVEGGEGGDGNEPAGNPQTVELPLNSDGTLDMENAVVAKYLPSSNGNSQSVDPDLTITPRTEKSFNERSGRNHNGMSW